MRINRDNEKKKIQVVQTTVTDARGSIVPRFFHCHPDYMEIMYIYAGKGVYYLDQKSYPVKAGDIVVFNAGGFHGEDPASTNSLCTYVVALKDVEEPMLLPNHLVFPGGNPIISCGDDAEEIEHLMKMICNLPKTRHARQIQTNLAVAMLYYCIDHLPSAEIVPGSKRYELVSSAKEYIDQHYKEEILFSQLADSLHVNSSYLSRLFSEIIHMSMKQYQIRLRLGAVQTMLIDTEKNVQEISSLCGFSDICHFNAVFKKNTGMTPTEYRESILQMEADK
ncbi:MAG: AraC family transcriptional regulator [Lachnospiraceae bacterium]|nr:AraC family transcriptional regulator [Lachnospiraceae bacterium]